MNFLNFCISIFKYKISPKKFILFIFIQVIFILLVSNGLKSIDIPLNNNDVIRHYQLSKIQAANFKNTQTIIIGDSSGGNAIDAKYFTQLSGLETQNLCLTGSWGILGSLGILKNAIAKNDTIKNVIIIQTIDIWNRPLARESIFELFSFHDIYISPYTNLNNIIGFFYNPKEVWWNIKHLFEAKNKIAKIDTNYDFLEQKKYKFSNGKKNIENLQLFDTFKLSADKKDELNELQKYCISKNLNCIFIHGPIHQKLIEHSKQYIPTLKHTLPTLFKIKYHSNICSYSEDKIGDSYDHIDTRYKKESTKNYFELLKNDLVK